MDDNIDSGAWFLGLIMALVGALLSATGYTLQRWSQIQNKKLSKDKQKPPYKQPANIIGIFLGILDAISEAVALNYAAESLIASLGTVPILLNMMIAPKFLNEKLSKRDYFVCVMIVIGTTLCVVFSNHSSFDMNWAQLYNKFFDIEFISYFVCMMILFTLLYYLSSGNIQDRVAWTRRVFSQSFVERMYSSEFLYKLQRGSIIMLAALSGSFTAMFGKAIVELVFDLIHGEDDFNQIGPWIVITMILFFFWNQIRNLNSALNQFSALMIVPFYETLYSLFGILNGAIFYRDFSGFSVGRLLLFILGISLNCVALIALSNRPGIQISEETYQGFELDISKSNHTLSSSDSAGVGVESPPHPL
jgi:hypothetical protein